MLINARNYFKVASNHLEAPSGEKVITTPTSLLWGRNELSVSPCGVFVLPAGTNWQPPHGHIAFPHRFIYGEGRLRFNIDCSPMSPICRLSVGGDEVSVLKWRIDGGRVVGVYQYQSGRMSVSGEFML